MTSLLEIYAALQNKRITLEEAAQSLGLTLRDLRFRLTRHGSRLPVMLATLDAIRNDEITREEAAHDLEITVRQVNQLMLSWKVRRPVKPYLVRRKISQIKWEIRKMHAIEYIAGSSSIEELAEAAEISDRQLRRWVSDLLREHFGMVFGDLKGLSASKRARLAHEIEGKEALSLAKQQALKALLRSNKGIEQAAIDAVMREK